MTHELPKLNYGFADLEPHYDAKTLEIHYSKHHQTYITKLNTALEGHTQLQNKTAEELISNLDAVPEKIRTAVTNHGGGHANHSLFWETMSPNGGGVATGSIAEAIDRDFGSFDAFKQEFSNKATLVFGSGWTWLVVVDGKLQIQNTLNQASPLNNGNKPVLVIDVWEHAYYLKFQNRRPEWIEAWWNLVNWEAVNSLYQA